MCREVEIWLHASAPTPRSPLPPASALEPHPARGLPVVLWRVEVLGTPAWRERCARCGQPSAHESTARFRVNSNGERHDLWLLYRCPRCGDTRKRRLAQRCRAGELPAGALEPSLHDDPTWARRHAFELASHEPLTYRVLRPTLPAEGELSVRIAQPEPCGERWDRFLAREVGWARGRVARAVETGALRLDAGASLARPLRDGQGFTLAKPARGE